MLNFYAIYKKSNSPKSNLDHIILKHENLIFKYKSLDFSKIIDIKIAKFVIDTKYSRFSLTGTFLGRKKSLNNPILKKEKYFSCHC